MTHFVREITALVYPTKVIARAAHSEKTIEYITHEIKQELIVTCFFVNRMPLNTCIWIVMQKTYRECLRTKMWIPAHRRKDSKIKL